MNSPPEILTIQLPQVSTRSFSQRVKMKCGQTLVLAGFEQETDQQSKGIGISAGGHSQKYGKSLIIITIEMESARSLAMRSIKIKKKEYAIGFWWQILDGKGKKQLFAKARSVAEDFKDRKYNCLVPRKQQYGLGSCEGDKIKRLPSLACALVERSTDTWIGMFCLADDLWWVCAVSKKTIVAEGDQFFSSRAEAQVHLASLKSMSSWNKDNEYICETVDESLSHFDGLLKPSERVQPLNPEHSNLKFIIGVAVILTACAGWYMWDSHQQDLREAEQRRIAREARQKELQKQETVQKDPEQLFAMVWKDTPLPSAFAHEFLRAVRNTEPYTLGWKLSSIVRDSDGHLHGLVSSGRSGFHQPPDR